MRENEIAIKAENISKYYRLGEINNGTLFKDIQSMRARRLGMEDPNAKIGENGYAQGGGGFYALRDINFEIKKGDRVGIIGRNGAGKSTLLKVISEVTAPTTGSIGINGRVASLLEVGTGFNPQMTGRENIYLNGAILGMKRTEINSKMQEIIEFSEIEKHIDTPVKRYSSGMYVRLAFAVAANLESEILIADEVLAVGDAQFQKKALGKMSEISTGQGRTVLFVSHQMNAVKALCEHGMVISSGKIAYSGDIGACVDHYQKGLLQDDESSDLAKYDNEFFDLLGFDLVNESGQIITGLIDNDTTGRIRVSVNVKKLHSGLNIGYALYDSEGTLIYWSVSTDTEEGMVLLKSGENVLYADIPSHFLNEGTYFIYLIGSVHHQEWLINPDKDSPRITIEIQGGLSKSPFWMLKRPGICAPLIRWEE